MVVVGVGVVSSSICCTGVASTGVGAMDASDVDVEVDDDDGGKLKYGIRPRTQSESTMRATVST